MITLQKPRFEPMLTYWSFSCVLRFSSELYQSRNWSRYRSPAPYLIYWIEMCSEKQSKTKQKKRMSWTIVKIHRNTTSWCHLHLWIYHHWSQDFASLVGALSSKRLWMAVSTYQDLFEIEKDGETSHQYISYKADKEVRGQYFFAADKLIKCSKAFLPGSSARLKTSPKIEFLSVFDSKTACCRFFALLRRTRKSVLSPWPLLAAMASKSEIVL